MFRSLLSVATPTSKSSAVPSEKGLFFCSDSAWIRGLGTAGRCITGTPSDQIRIPSCVQICYWEARSDYVTVLIYVCVSVCVTVFHTYRCYWEARSDYVTVLICVCVSVCVTVCTG